MKSKTSMQALLLGLIFIFGVTTLVQAGQEGLDQNGIAQAMGKKGTATGDIYKVSFPRSDLQVKVGKVIIKPEFALTNWAAFKKSGVSSLTYGDLVLLENELNPVISKLEEKELVFPPYTTILFMKLQGSFMFTSWDTEMKWP